MRGGNTTGDEVGIVNGPKINICSSKIKEGTVLIETEHHEVLKTYTFLLFSFLCIFFFFYL